MWSAAGATPSAGTTTRKPRPGGRWGACRTCGPGSSQAPSPAKAGGEAVRLRTIGSRADERTPAVLAGRRGWGGVPSGSARAVTIPSRPPPAVAGEEPRLAAEAAPTTAAGIRPGRLSDNPRHPSGPCPTSVNLEELLAFAGRHQLLSIALVGLTIAIIVNEVMQLFRGYKTLRPAGLTALITRHTALVVALRPS